MASTAAVVFLIGIMFMLLGAIRARDARFEKTRQQILNNEEGDEDMRIVYKLLPRDVDTFYRTQETPSKLYGSLFSLDVDDPRRV